MEEALGEKKRSGQRWEIRHAVLQAMARLASLTYWRALTGLSACDGQGYLWPISCESEPLHWPQDVVGFGSCECIRRLALGSVLVAFTASSKDP